MSAAREAIAQELVRSLRYNADVMTLISRDEAFRNADYNRRPHSPPIASFIQMSAQLEQYALDIEERLVQRVKP